MVVCEVSLIHCITFHMTKYFLLFCCRHLAWPLHWLTLAQVSEVSVVVSGPGPGSGAVASPRCPGCCWRHIALTLSHCQHLGHHKAGPHLAPRAQTVHHQHQGEEGASTLFYWINCIDIVVKMNQLFQFREETYIFSLFLVSIYIYLLLPHFSIYLQYLLLRFIIFQIPSKLNRSKKPNNNNATTETF